MIYIFHGDDQGKSRKALNDLVDTLPKDAEILRLDSKNSTLEAVNNFLNGQSFFDNPKALIISNYYSIPKATLDKITPIIAQTQVHTIILWQDKKLATTHTKLFPGAQIQVFEPSLGLFSAVNAIRPGNLDQFVKIYKESLETQAFELLFYQIKGSLRRQISTYSKFPQNRLLAAYLQLIEMEFQYKTGQLTIAKETALMRIISNLIVAS